MNHCSEGLRRRPLPLPLLSPVCLHPRPYIVSIATLHLVQGCEERRSHHPEVPCKNERLLAATVVGVGIVKRVMTPRSACQLVVPNVSFREPGSESHLRVSPRRTESLPKAVHLLTAIVSGSCPRSRGYQCHMCFPTSAARQSQMNAGLYTSFCDAPASARLDAMKNEGNRVCLVPGRAGLRQGYDSVPGAGFRFPFVVVDSVQLILPPTQIRPTQRAPPSQRSAWLFSTTTTSDRR